MDCSAVPCLSHQGAMVPGPGLLWAPRGLGQYQALVRWNKTARSWPEGPVATPE